MDRRYLPYTLDELAAGAICYNRRPGLGGVLRTFQVGGPHTHSDPKGVPVDEIERLGATEIRTRSYFKHTKRVWVQDNPPPPASWFRDRSR